MVRIRSAPASHLKQTDPIASQGVGDTGAGGRRDRVFVIQESQPTCQASAWSPSSDHIEMVASNLEFAFCGSARDGGWNRRLVCSRTDHVARCLRSTGHHDLTGFHDLIHDLNSVLLSGGVVRRRQDGRRQFPRPLGGRLGLRTGAWYRIRPRCGCGSRRRDQD